MAKIQEGAMKAKGRHFAIVASRFNEFVTKRLLNACLKELKGAGARDSEVTVFWVPGSFEVPLVALKLAKKKSIDIVICLGAVIKGETLHFDLISRTVTEGIARAGLESGKPVIFGVLTTYTTKQALKRSEPHGDNKGRDAARAAVQMANLIRKI